MTLSGKCSLRLLLLAGGLALAAPSASAQDVSGYGNGGSETVIVTAPHFRAETTPLNGPLERVSYSQAVPYNDLDLRTYEGARELRHRIREEARDVCERLADAYPVYKAPGSSCYKTAVDNGLVRADEAIQTARQYDRDGYYATY